jgi:hypothetical protein
MFTVAKPSRAVGAARPQGTEADLAELRQVLVSLKAKGTAENPDRVASWRLLISPSSGFILLQNWVEAQSHWAVLFAKTANAIGLLSEKRVTGNLQT